MDEKMRVALVSPSRNEGPYLLEWLAWHRMLGFDDILVLTNDCSDGSGVLLDALAARGFLRHIEHFPQPGEPPLKSAYNSAMADPGVRAADWVMALDSDEFLQVFVPGGTIQDLLRAAGGGFLGMAVHWKIFGSNGVDTWRDGFVRSEFPRAAAGQIPPNRFFKSVFRNLDQFQKMGSHAPLGFTGTWGGENIWVDSVGARLNTQLSMPKKHSRATSRPRITHSAAQINHYAVKSRESFALKSTQRSGAQLIYRHNEAFFEKFDRNETLDTSALSREAEFAAEYGMLTASEEIQRLHHACCARYVARLCEAAGKRPDEDQRFLFHRDRAGSDFQ